MPWVRRTLYTPANVTKKKTRRRQKWLWDDTTNEIFISIFIDVMRWAIVCKRTGHRQLFSFLSRWWWWWLLLFIIVFYLFLFYYRFSSLWLWLVGSSTRYACTIVVLFILPTATLHSSRCYSLMRDSTRWQPQPWLFRAFLLFEFEKRNRRRSQTCARCYWVLQPSSRMLDFTLSTAQFLSWRIRKLLVASPLDVIFILREMREADTWAVCE